ncbi:MAG: hypothetical protein ACODAU_13090 [Myxococcota bacterium]
MFTLRHFPGALLIAALALAGCGDGGGSTPTDAGLEPIEPTYENVERIVDNSCTFSSCHGGSGSGKAQLNMEQLIEAGDPVTEALVDVPACEYHVMPRVDPGNPENSWLWVKLDPENMNEEGEIQFEPDPSFDPEESPYSSPNCPLTEEGQVVFGTNMPQQLGDPMPLPANEREAIRQWIEMGAPGPGGGTDAGTDGGAVDAGAPDAGTDAGATDGG